jgi:transposase-like protein
MNIHQGVSLFGFIERFKTDDDCKAYLAELKWAEGFECPKCGCKDCYKGVKEYTKVCKSCRHVESSSANTLFHKVKFGLRKAFTIVYEMSTTPNGMSALQASRKFEINYDSAWLFMKKVRIAMESGAKHPMVGKVYVDEFVIGGYEQGAVGRKSDSKKIKMIMAVEVTNRNKIKRMYCMRLKGYGSGELGKIFEKHISKDAKVMTDEWRGYWPLMKDWNITQDKECKNNSPVNRMIQQTKSWIRGTHHAISERHVLTYTNEYSFRINRSLWKDTIFHKCVERMASKPKQQRLQVSGVRLMSREAFVQRVMLYENMKVAYRIEYGKVKLAA